MLISRIARRFPLRPTRGLRDLCFVILSQVTLLYSTSDTYVLTMWLNKGHHRRERTRSRKCGQKFGKGNVCDDKPKHFNNPLTSPQPPDTGAGMVGMEKNLESLNERLDSIDLYMKVMIGAVFLGVWYQWIFATCL